LIPKIMPRPGHTKRFWWAAAISLVVVELLVYARTIPETLRWTKEPVLSLDLPETLRDPQSGYEFLDQPERLKGVVEQLAFAKGRCGVFLPLVREGKRRTMEFFYFEYAPGNPRFIHDVFGHLPEVCMSATGAVLKQEHPSRSITVGGRSHKVLVLEFVSPLSTQPMWIFRMTWLPEGVPYDPYEMSYLLRSEKFLIGLTARPKPPARILLAGATGYETLDEAWASYERLLVSRLKIVAP
jgi:hypothetical protein